jgi:aminoglycoside phosphotransferase (APT) family kinase protein
MRHPLLNANNVFRYLQDRHLLGLDDVARVRAHDLSRRNHNLVVEVDGHLVWFIKQIQYDTPEVIASIHREAHCYLAAQDDVALATLHSLMPRCADFDDANCILILAYLDGVNAADAHVRVGPFDVRVAEVLGRLLGTVHRATPLVLQSAVSRVFSSELPWVLRHAGAHEYSGTRSRFLSLFESDLAISRALVDLRESWQTDTVIHGDARLENFVFCRPSEPLTPFEAKLVDWELADLGDAAWDCANVTQHYWTQWMSRGASTPLRWIGLETALTSFWLAYLSARGFLGRPDARRSIRRATVFTGARLIQTAYEQFAGARWWSPSVECSIRLACLLLLEPDRALEGLEYYQNAA